MGPRRQHEQEYGGELRGLSAKTGSLVAPLNKEPVLFLRTCVEQQRILERLSEMIRKMIAKIACTALRDGWIVGPLSGWRRGLMTAHNFIRSACAAIGESG
jgi:hypothetical protein